MAVISIWFLVTSISHPTPHPPLIMMSVTKQTFLHNLVNKEKQICSDILRASVDHIAMASLAGSMVYTLGNSGLVGEPRPMSEVFPGLPNNIDNAVYAPNRKTYFFKVKIELLKM